MAAHADPPPLSLYVHVPWCVRKCPYCDFNSHPRREALPERAYIDALLADLDQELAETGRRQLVSIFIGGGTPSLLSGDAVARLLAGIRARMPLASMLEVTLEANPGTAEQARFAEYRAAGVTRLSIGVQSFADDLLERLGRIHGGREAVAAAEAAHAAGFDDFNLDLMFGLPGQSPERALRDLHIALELAPTHLSWYQLTIEPNTAFWHRPPALPDDDTVWAMQQDGQALLAARGFAQYEISAYARPGHQCRHNRNYWEFGDYLGIGAGAHGKLSDMHGQVIRRRWKRRHPREYLEGAARPARIAGERKLDRGDRVLEFMMNALRLNEGVPIDLFHARTGLPTSLLEGPLRQARERELVAADAARLRATEQGRRFLNDLLALFMDGGGEVTFASGAPAQGEEHDREARR